MRGLPQHPIRQGYGDETGRVFHFTGIALKFTSQTPKLILL